MIEIDMRNGYLNNNGFKPYVSGRASPVAKLVFFSIVIAFWLLAFMIHLNAVNTSFNKTLYHVFMLPVCLWPAFMLDHKNSSNSLIIIFSIYYYAAFSLFDFFVFSIWQLDLLKNFVVGVDRSLMLAYSYRTSLSEITILLGIILFQIGYFLLKSFNIENNRALNRHSKDWKPGVIFTIAFIFSMAGLAANCLVWLFHITEDQVSVVTILVANFSYFGMISTAMLVYLINIGYSRNKTIFLFVVILTIQGLIAFTAGSKEFFMQPILLLFLGYYLFNRKVNKKALLFTLFLVSIFILIYPYMYQSRNVSEHKRLTGMDRLESYSDSSEIVSKQQLFLQGLVLTTNRVNAKGSIDTVIYATKRGTPLQYGRTIKLFFYSFIPKILWSGRPDLSIGKEVNEAFNVSSTKETYIALTYLGEMYWNFGLAGVLLGMLLYGVILSYINSKCSLNTYPYLLNFVVLLITTYHLVFRFEAGIGTKVHYIRTVIIIVTISYLVNKMGLFRRLQK